MMGDLSKQMAAEAIGTFCLVFAGTSAIVVNASTSGAVVSHVGIALTFGLVVFAMIAAVGDVSGAHLNPAVTFGFWIAGRLPRRRVAAYVVAQVCGGLAASCVVRLLFPQAASLGGTAPSGTPLQSWIMEMLLTAILMFVILSVSTGSREKGITAGLAIGGVVALEALCAGPVSGASMNPARSLAPALVTGRFDHLWIYLSAPIVGAALAVLACRCAQAEGCCPCAPERSW
jgi:aquaporin Z